jgi:hypothetical protein
MSITSKVLTAAVALALVGGFSAAGTRAAGAATKDCGGSCVDVSSRPHPAQILDAQGGGAGHAGQSVVLASDSHASDGEDFTIDFAGQVTDFIRAGVISHGLAKYGSLRAYELQYSPGGSPTHNCLGVGAAPADSTPVALEPCGRTGRTVWICAPVGSYFTLISGATDGNFANPAVLTALSAGGKLVAQPVNAKKPAVFLRQQWGSDVGALKSGQPATASPLCGASA